MKIVIVGGGTAGWLAAAMISVKYPDNEVVVIESSKIGIIGVGESTTGYFTELLLNDLAEELDLNHDEFIIETGATLKFGIKHKAWTTDIDSHYYGVLEGSPTVSGTPDLMFAYNYSEDPSRIITATHTGHLLYNNLSNLGHNDEFQKYGHAMHIDAGLTGKYFAKKTLKRKNVKHIDSEIRNCELDEEGFITALTLSNEQTVKGDFFIDCTGFSRALINKLDDRWITYKKHLPVDTAIPFPESYQENEMPVPCTTAWAQKCGWMWQTPLLDRRGNGYVFDSNFITVDRAQEEIETLLGRKINPLKIIKFDTGRKKNAWVKNCMAIGLSYAFVEPLEATSIHTTIVQIKTFVNEYLRPSIEDTVNPRSVDMFNHRIGRHIDDVVDFLVLHYQGGRTDSEFWRYISSGETRTDFVSNLIETVKHRLPTINDFPRYYGSAGWELYCYILAGLNLIDRSKVLDGVNLETKRELEISDFNLKRYLDFEYRDYKSYERFVEKFRQIRNQKSISP